MPVDYSERKLKLIPGKDFRGSSGEGLREAGSGPGSPRKMDVSSQGVIRQHLGDETPLKRATTAHPGKDHARKYPRHLQLVVAKKGPGGAASKKGAAGQGLLPAKHSVTPTAETAVRNHFYFPNQQENNYFAVIDRRKIKVVRDEVSPEGRVNLAYRQASKHTFERTQQLKIGKTLRDLDMESDEYLLGDEAAFDDEADSMNEGIPMPHHLVHSQSQLEHHQLRGSQLHPSQGQDFQARA